MKKIQRVGYNSFIVSNGKNSLTATAFFVNLILKENNKSGLVTQAQLSGLIHFIVTHSEGVPVTNLKYVFEAAEQIDSLGIRFPSLKKDLFQESNNVSKVKEKAF